MLTAKHLGGRRKSGPKNTVLPSYGEQRAAHNSPRAGLFKAH